MNGNLDRVAIDASSASSGGAVRWLSGILPSMAEARPETEFYLLNRASHMSRLPSLPANVHWVGIPRATGSRLVRLLWLQVGLPRMLRNLGVEVLLGASDVSTLRPPCPFVLMTHNLNPFSPVRSQIWGRRQRIRLALQRELVRRCAQRADRVVFVSESSRQAMAPGLGILLEKSTVVHHGVDDVFVPSQAVERPGDGRRFLLVVSAVLEHKNLARLIEAYGNLVSSLGEELDLVVAGPIGSVKLRQSLEQSVADSGLSSRVRFLGSVSSIELAELYRQAGLLVFPSLEETFGLPLIEAMASGLPVVASNISAIPEICGNAADYFDPYDVADMAGAMERVLRDTSLREAMVQRGLERASSFTWTKAAQELLSVMSDVVRDRR